MRNVVGNFWDLIGEYDAGCVTTNCFVKSNGRAVMGRGLAREALRRHPGIDLLVAELGCALHELCSDPTLVNFPVKPASVRATVGCSNVVKHMRRQFRVGHFVPGWAAVAEHELIAKSAARLVDLADHREWKRVLLPRPGCGAGELTWATVEPVLQEILDDRFAAVTFR